MKDAVPRLNLTPKLSRPLQLWNPLDYMRLLYWIFYFPKALRWYEETFVAPEYRGAKGKVLWQAVTQDVVLRHLILQALILLFLFMPLVFFIPALVLPEMNSLIALASLALFLVLFAVLGVALGMAFCAAFGVIVGVVVVVAFAVALLAFGFVAELGVFLIALGIVSVFDVPFDALNALNGVPLAGAFLGAPVGAALGVATVAAIGVIGFVAEVVALGVAEVLALSAIGGLLFSAAGQLTLGMAFCVAFCMAGVLAFCVAAALAILRPDVWAVAALISSFSYPHYKSTCTILPLPNLRQCLKDWLECDWQAGVHNLNEMLAYSMQFIPVVQAFNESLAEHPTERMLMLVDEVSRHPYDWNLLRYASASPANELKTNAIDVFPLPGGWKQHLKKRYSKGLRLDTPARATCAGFWYLHEKQSLQATQAFAVVRSLPNGEGMHSLSQALHLAQSVKGFQDLENLAGQEAFRKATTKPSEPIVLHPETWQALEHLRHCALEAHAVHESVSKAARSWALNRAIGEVVAVQKMIGTLPEAERALVEEIAKSWQSILVSQSAEVGSISISEPVKNPYVAGDPVVGSGFKGREDTIRELKQLWSGTTKPPSVVLYGHRRMGKTSILRNINSHLGSEVRLAYVNLLILGGAERGLSDLFLAIADEIRASLPELPEAEMDEFDRHPELAFKQYLDLAQSALGKSRLIIALDEFEKLEVWMNAGRIPGDLLDTFRGYIQKDHNIAFAFAGLHKLEEMTEDYFNPLFASVRPIRVSFLSKDATFQVLANPPLEDFSLDFQPEALERIWELTGGQPYLVQLVGHYLVSRFNRLTFELGKPMKPVFSLDDVDAVIEDPEFYSQGQYYFSGIWGQAGQGAEGQQEMLKLLASSPDGVSFEGIISHSGPDSEEIYTAALKELQRHDVLRQKDGQWQFTVELMRRWVKDFMQNSDN